MLMKSNSGNFVLVACMPTSGEMIINSRISKLFYILFIRYCVCDVQFLVLINVYVHIAAVMFNVHQSVRLDFTCVYTFSTII